MNIKLFRALYCFVVVLVTVLFCVGSSIAFASPVAQVPVSFNFAGVSLASFAQATYKNLLGRDYVIAPDLVNIEKKITISVKALDAEKIPAFVDGILLNQGVKSSLRDGVYYLEAVKEIPVSAAPHAVTLAQTLGLAPSIAPAPLLAPGGPLEGREPLSKTPDDVEVVTAKNRPGEFLASVLASAFPGVSVRVAGAQLVVTAPNPRMQEVLRVAALIDLAPRIVEVSASFVEVNRSSSSTRGLALVAAALSRKFGVSLVPSAGTLQVNAGSYQLVLDALAADGRFKQVSNSRVVGDEAERMMLSVGDETPTIGSNAKDQQGVAIQNIVYRSSGVILDVLPRVLGSGVMKLDVDGQVSSFQATLNGVTGSPTLVKRQVKTSVSVADGQVLLIGGLDDSKVASNEAGFSFLPKSWASRTASDSSNDLVLILSARLLK